jgi:hypothetical protein
MVRPVSTPNFAASLANIATPRPSAESSPPMAPDAPAAAGSLAAPPGASPALWSLLTAEERSFFFEQAALGPSTYKPGGRPAESAPAPLGQRLDVRG